MRRVSVLKNRIQEKINRVISRALAPDLQLLEKRIRNEIADQSNMIQTKFNSDLDRGFARFIPYLFLRINDIESKFGKEKVTLNNFQLVSENRVALDSADHLFPHGTAKDETRSPAFVQSVLNHFQRSIDYLDIGCAGGGLVYDFVRANCLAVGLEGSDYSERSKRAYWNLIPNNLFTCDVTKKFKILKDNEVHKFDLIGAWEFLEHISERDLPSVLENIALHLKSQESLFVGNISTFHEHSGSACWHVTVKPEEWWKEIFVKSGFEIIEDKLDKSCFPRGTSNLLGTWGGDYNVTANSDLGFAFTARLMPKVISIATGEHENR